jgi:hypothetical protein
VPLAIALALLAGGPVHAQDSPEAVYRNYIAALRARNTEETTRYLSKHARGKLLADPRELRETMLEVLSAFMPTSVRVVKTTVSRDDTRAVLELMGLSALDGKPTSGKVALIKEGVEWRVDREEWSDAKP